MQDDIYMHLIYRLEMHLIYRLPILKFSDISRFSDAC